VVKKYEDIEQQVWNELKDFKMERYRELFEFSICPVWKERIANINEAKRFAVKREL
jgi:hypothetical protein